jgi:hypothetical protein
MPEITVHPTMAKVDLDEVLAASLRANRLDPKLLYVTPRQAELWREVSRKHSPIHANPEFSRIYREAYARVAEEMPRGKIQLVGLGPGTGFKEAELAARLVASGHEVHFSAIDVSRELVEEAAGRVATVGARTGRHLVCDLAELDFIKAWLEADEVETPRLFTLFGVAPNLEATFTAKLLRELVRPDDWLLASVHLAPVSEKVSIEAAMDKIVPQYDNVETLAWLREATRQWKLDERMREPRILRDEQAGIPCIRGMAPINSSHAWFQLFLSLRYTPELFDELLYSAGVRGELLAMTACREEAIWAVRCA